jgi:heat shock protein HslJ
MRRPMMAAFVVLAAQVMIALPGLAQETAALFCSLIVGCTAHGQGSPAVRSTDPRAVVGQTWQWEATVTPVERITVPHPERYTILLLDDGRMQARFDCNHGGGTYEITAGKLSFGPLLSTRMACPPDSLDGPYMRDLQRVVSFFLQDGHLYLELPADSGTMRFRPSP